MNRERRKALQTIVDQLETLQMQLCNLRKSRPRKKNTGTTSPKTSRAANGTSVSKKSAKACPMQ